jgi:hypothetical protein
MGRVEKVMNTQVPGTQYSPSHWSFTSELTGEKGKKKYKIWYLRLTNFKVRWAWMV